MARFNLAQISRARSRKRGRRTFRPVTPTNALASDLAAIYLPFVEAWSAAIEPILAEYERTLAAITTDSAADLGRIIDGTDGGLLRLFLSLSPRLKDWVLRVERWHRDRWVGSALTASGVDLSTVLTPGDVRETVETVIERNVALVRNVADQARYRIADIVFRGVQQRQPAREVAKELREAVGMSRRRALNIASDQASKLISDLDTARMKQAGIEKWEWKSSHKQHFRPEHAARDGKVYTWENAPKDLPGQLPYCGCRKLAVIDFDE